MKDGQERYWSLHLVIMDNLVFSQKKKIQDSEIGKMAQWLRDPPERWSPRLGFQEML